MKGKIMKKIMTSLVLSAFVLTATPALADNGGKDHNKNNGRANATAAAKFRLGWFGRNDDNKDKQLANRFSVVGTVTASTATSLTLTVQDGAKNWNIPAGQSLLLALNADTKYSARGNEASGLANIAVGEKVVVAGKLENNVYTATHVWDLGTPAQKSYGKVTAKTDTSITIQNSSTGTTQTFTVDGDTKIAVNGEAKTIADINVGDAGVVKSKPKGDSLWAKIIKLFR
jgi:hypothetical protein